MFWLEARAEDVDVDAHDRTRVEHRADACLGVVAHEQAAEGLPGVFQLFSGVVVELDVGIVVFQVGVVGIGPQVAPFADDRVAEVAIVAFVTVAEEYRIINLAAHFAIRPDGGVGSNLRPLSDDRAFAQRKRPLNNRALTDRRVAAQINRPTLRVQNRRADCDTFFDKNIFGRVAARVRVV